MSDVTKFMGRLFSLSIKIAGILWYAYGTSILGLAGNQNGGMVLLTGDTLFYTSNLFKSNLCSDAKKS